LTTYEWPTRILTTLRQDCCCVPTKTFNFGAETYLGGGVMTAIVFLLTKRSLRLSLPV